MSGSFISDLSHDPFGGRIVYLIFGKPKLGKAQPLDAKVLTPTGFRSMGDLRIGDDVIGAAGKSIKVAGIFPQGKRPVYRVTMGDGGSTECCDEHLWFTTTRQDHVANRGGSVKPLSQIRKTLLISSGKYDKHNHYLPCVQEVDFGSQKVQAPLHPYVLGLLLGDGSWKGSNVVLHNNEADLIDRFSSLLPGEDMIVSNKDDRGAGINSRVKRRVQTGKSSETKQALHSLGLGEADCSGKFIPARYLYGTIEERIALLRGLVDSDGYVQGGRSVEYTTVSRKLAEDLAFLVRSLGGVVRTTIKKSFFMYLDERRAGAETWRLHIAFPALVPCASQKHLAKWKAATYQMGRYIESVELVGEKECQCILVDSEDHLYVTDDFILTHNTSLLLRMLKEHTEQTALLISADKGDTQVRLDPGSYQGRLAISRPTTLREWRVCIHEATTRIENAVKKRPPGTVWCVLDTTTHMQVQLLTESRKLSVMTAKSGKGRIEDGDEYTRDLITQVDYNVNLGHMAEITNSLMRLPCNLVFFALERTDTDAFERKTSVPSLSGQSRDKVMGDADVIARLVKDDGEARRLLVAPGSGWTAGDRTGRLAAEEPADLWAMHQKILAKPEAKA